MPLSETARALACYLGRQAPGERPCYEDPIRDALNLDRGGYRAAVDELVDYGLVGPALAGAGDAYGCIALTEAGKQALAAGLSPESLPLTPAALARNPIVAASWAIDRVACGQELPAEREALVGEIVWAVRGLLPPAQECLPTEAMASARAAAEALIAELGRTELQPEAIRQALCRFGLPEGASTLNSPLVHTLPALAAAIDTLLRK